MDRQPMVPIRLDNCKSLRELVFESLHEAIISNKFCPGERLSESQLAEELWVSRTPVREAIRQLELEGLILVIPRKGVYVSGISIKDIADVFEIRSALEGLAAELAAERITAAELENMERYLVKMSEDIESGNLTKVVQTDADFHTLLYKASRNNRLSQIINNLKEQIQRFRITSLSCPGRIKVAVEEHRKIMEAISNRDSKTARQFAREHIENAENSMMEMIRQDKKYGDD